MHNPGKINIAIDGYSACGKSTLAQALAKILHYNYVDSGAMYRAVTLYAIRHGLIESDLDQLKSLLPKIKIECLWSEKGNKTLLNGEDVSQLIRTPEVLQLVSQVSAIAEVRRYLVAQQRDLCKNGGVVMDGRDIGTVVMPDAALKIFMTADPLIRADRRLKELVAKGIYTDREEVLQNLAFRDHIDSTREDSPLVKAEDAIILDNSHLTPESQLNKVLDWVKAATNQ